MSQHVSPKQREQFIRDGYVVVSGLIPSDIVTSIRQQLCEAIGMKWNDSSTWPTDGRQRGIHIEHIELTEPCHTPELAQAAHELLGDTLLAGQRIVCMRAEKGEEPYAKGLTPVLAYPCNEGEPGQDGFHIDGLSLATLWPDKMLAIALAYLTDTSERGGATQVIPESHRKVFEYWYKRGQEPAGSKALLPPIDLGKAIHVAGKAGDVIFMHHLMVHSGSANHDQHVRIALNANLTSDPKKPYQRKTTGPSPQWTPLDQTLRTDNIALA